jgi:hypothetical protein
MRTFTKKLWTAIVGSYRCFFRFLLKVHYFDFWEWVARQAHPEQMGITHDRYERLSIDPVDIAGIPPAWMIDDYQ